MGLVRMKQERYAEARALPRARDRDRPALGPKAHYQLSLACARLGDDAGQAEAPRALPGGAAEVAVRLAELRAGAGGART